MSLKSKIISTYIADLEKDNADLRKQLKKIEEEKALLEYENMLKYAVASHEDSIAS